jgi:hypothetical protein
VGSRTHKSRVNSVIYLQIEGPGRPISRILLYPAIHLRGSAPGSLGEPRLPVQRTGWVRRDILACSHRWFTWPVPHGIPPVGSYPTLSPITCAGRRPRPSAGLLSVALDVAEGLHRTAPRVFGPSGLCYESGLCSEPEQKVRAQRRVGRPRPSSNYTLVGQVLGSRWRSLAREPRLRSTILVGVRCISTLSALLQRFCQRGSSPTAGSNQTPGP